MTIHEPGYDLAVFEVTGPERTVGDEALLHKGCLRSATTLPNDWTFRVEEGRSKTPRETTAGRKDVQKHHACLIEMHSGIQTRAASFAIDAKAVVAQPTAPLARGSRPDIIATPGRADDKFQFTRGSVLLRQLSHLGSSIGRAVVTVRRRLWLHLSGAVSHLID